MDWLNDRALALGLAASVSTLVLGVVRLRHKKYDHLRWLEEIDSTRALDWVRSRNADLAERGLDGSKGPMFERLKENFDCKEKIPYVSKINDDLYNFWKDEKNERGLWRKTTLEGYLSKSPEWTPVIDLDALSAKENEKWVWKGSRVLNLGPGIPKERALVFLSPGGTDAVQVREFCLIKNEFLAEDQQPFTLPAAKTSISYKDRDTVLVGSDFGPGSLTSSGYPRILKEWKRGTPISAAKTIFEGDDSDVSVSTAYIRERGGVEYQMIWKSTGFYTSRKFVTHVSGLTGPDGTQVTLPGGKRKELCLPEDCDVATFADQVLILPRTDWKGYASGTLLALPAYKVLMATRDEDISPQDLSALFVPSETRTLKGYTKVKTHIVLEVMDNIKGVIETWRYEGSGKWAPLKSLSDNSDAIQTIDCWAFDGQESERYWMTSESFVQPPTLSIAQVGDKTIQAKQETTRFDASNLVMEQHFATSLDGTKVPYFQVGSKQAKVSPRPTLLYGYGGFEISLEATYQVTTGICWLETGNVYVMANIRGGGEYGPKWHQAALKENRNKAYEDFEAIARDLVRRGVTTHEMLGCCGGSNGGLLTGNMLTRSPELFGAIVVQVPLLDMYRFNLLLAGASWMGEYGDPSTEDWENFLHKYSPYHNLRADRVKDYPATLFTTSTRDDRVSPAHARKMVRKMIDLGIQNVNYWENIEGGHGGASTNEQRAAMWSLTYQFLHASLKK